MLRIGQNAHGGRFAPAKGRFAPWCEAKRPLVSFCICAFWEQKEINRECNTRVLDSAV